MRNSPVTRSAWDVVQKAIQDLRRDVLLLKNAHSPTVPVYLPDVPDDQINGQIALVPVDEVLDLTATDVKPAWSFGDVWRPFGPDTSGDSVSDLILATSPAAFWKLNEAAGNVAADSSGNGHDMTSVGWADHPPTWGQTAGPPGDTSAKWPIPTGIETYGEKCTLTAYTNNFTAGVWVKALSGAGAIAGELLGQGTPHHVSGGSTGWDLFISTSTGFYADFGSGSSIVSNAAPSLDTWYFVAVVRDAGTWKLYVNGILQTATSTTTPGAGSTTTWIGNDMFASHGTFAQNVLLSYAFITNSVVSGTDLLAIYEAGLGGGSLAAGSVWTADGAGSASWELPTVEVDY